ncbi:RidA family protein [Brevibacillus centrosporus]|uniref:RidA family protein n=1 Tax=Brevibacillus centrosporus TaxID=54910 RepID=UPI0035A24F3E
MANQRDWRRGNHAKTGSVLFPNQMEKQTILVLQYISEILDKAGSSLNNILKVNAFLNDMNDFHKYDTAYASFFGTEPPARCSIGIGQFPLEGVCVEIECIAFC